MTSILIPSMPNQYHSLARGFISPHADTITSSASVVDNISTPPVSPLSQKSISSHHRAYPQEVNPKTPSRINSLPESSAATDNNHHDDHKNTSRSLKRSLPFDEPTNSLDKVLLEMAPRKTKSMLDRRKRARKNGETDISAIWGHAPSTQAKSHSHKQVQRISNEVEQVLSVLCDGDMDFAADVLVNLMTKRHLGSNLLQTVEQKVKSLAEKTLDTRIVDGIVSFFEHHHSKGTRPTEEARAVDAVMVACCWDVCDNDDVKADTDKSSGGSLSVKRVSNTALIDRLGINRGTFRRVRARAKSIKAEGKTRYKPKERKPRKDKGVPAQLYRMVKEVDDSTGSTRETNEYAAIDALSTMNTDVEKNHTPRRTPSPEPRSHVSPVSPHSSPLHTRSGVTTNNTDTCRVNLPYEHVGLSQSQHIAAERDRIEQNARNLLYGAPRPYPLHRFNQLLQYGPTMLQSSVYPMQTSLLRYLENQGRLGTPGSMSQDRIAESYRRFSM